MPVKADLSNILWLKKTLVTSHKGSAPVMHFESTSTLTARGLKLPSVHRARGCYAVAPKQVTGACAEQGQSRGRAGAEQLGSTSRVALEGWAALHGVALQGVATSRGCEFKGLHLHCRGWPRTAVPTWLSPCTAARRVAWPGAHALPALARGDRCAAQQLVTESGRACIYCTNLAVPVALPVFFISGDVTRSVQSRAI